MARILFAWELGSGLGHLNRMLQIARALQERGHVVCMAVRDLSGVQRLVQPQDRLIWFQAPVWLHSIGRNIPSATYAELLLTGGFLDFAGLWGLVCGWRALFASIQPDLLIADHAPVSLLSVQGTAIRKVTIGTGFYYPPPISPTPVFRSWENISEQRVLTAESRVLTNTNQVLEKMGCPPLQHMHELFAVDACFLTVWPELDHYHPRPGERHEYTGPLIEQVEGISSEWPAMSGKRIFAYLKASYSSITQVLQGLSNSGAVVLAYVAGLTLMQREQFASPTLKFADGPVHFGEVLQQADLVVCHGGMGTVSSALKAGKPVLTLPMHAEQRITGEKLRALGYGACLMDEEITDKFGMVLQTLLYDSQFRIRLSDACGAYYVQDTQLIVNHIVGRCEQLIGM